MTPYLSIEELSVSYGGTRVLDHVSLGVERGEMIALLGSSGCGKTTLLRSIAGFVIPERASSAWRARTSRALPPEKRAHRDDVPVVRAVAAHDRRRQHRLWLADARLEEATRSRRASARC